MKTEKLLIPSQCSREEGHTGPCNGWPCEAVQKQIIINNNKKEKEMLDDVFGIKKWKGKYKVEWCDLCDCATIICPACGLNDCSCGGCKECGKDHKEWRKVKNTVHHYLNENEKLIYDKCLRIKKHLLESIGKGENEINFKKLQAGGNLSSNEEIMFQRELL